MHPKNPGCILGTHRLSAIPPNQALSSQHAEPGCFCFSKVAGRARLRFNVRQPDSCVFSDITEMSSSTLANLLQLPKRKRLEIAERLWLSVADESKMPVSAEHKKVLRQRIADYRSGRAKVITHEELLRRVKSA
jgi:putative addiction module component (TIGR02574 family)